MDNFTKFHTRRPYFNVNTILDFAPLTEPQKVHLTKVYTTLAFSALVTFLSVVINGPWTILHPLFGVFLVLGSIFYIIFTKTSRNDSNYKRLVALFLFSLGLGITYRNYILQAFVFKPEIVTTALMGSIGIFGSFSLASLFMKTRMAMYLGALIFSLSNYIVMVNFANYFFRSRFVNNVTLILGLFLFVGYIAFDTQMVLREVKNGNEDYIYHAMMLYYDLFALFLELLIYLMEKEKSKSKKEKK
ncbi:Inhibitor of apoptosis-promoting Bax1 family protein [Theileria parva strain Muguga]|uniref:Bax inhibitor 1 n=1 Tax=Theileria parva TaxID=5875 RepID=Q4N3R8_THEPA|nr:Inhibitor of apoptosis-promoting Bax1 family protein [Theileria parva strain Muguga]EAN33205.1 Inhibitor of apoptosis-promoting Bax1 family protein [Theileria parva strain Muguga]|eukprot:XP_765488.1 hypothetical protein [Theileria parva strain Muguga]